MPLRAIILDFDGVLVESTEAKDEAFRAVFATFPDVAEAAYAFHRQHLHASRHEKFRYLVEQLLGRSGDQVLAQQLTAEYGRRAYEAVARASEVPGASAFLQRFSQDLPLFVASVTPQAELARMIDARGWTRHIRRAYGDPPTRKPDAVGQALREAGCQAQDAVLVGDAPTDLEAARAHGVSFLGRDGGLPFPDPGIRLYRDLHEIAPLIQQQLGASPHG